MTSRMSAKLRISSALSNRPSLPSATLPPTLQFRAFFSLPISPTSGFPALAPSTCGAFSPLTSGQSSTDSPSGKAVVSVDNVQNSAFGFSDLTLFISLQTLLISSYCQVCALCGFSRSASVAGAHPCRLSHTLKLHISLSGLLWLHPKPHCAAFLLRLQIPPLVFFFDIWVI